MMLSIRNRGGPELSRSPFFGGPAIYFVRKEDTTIGRMVLMRKEWAYI